MILYAFPGQNIQTSSGRHLLSSPLQESLSVAPFAKKKALPTVEPVYSLVTAGGFEPPTLRSEV